MQNQTRRPLLLTEWQTTTADLSPAELGDLQASRAELIIQPRGGSTFAIQPTSVVGAINTPSLRVVIEPKFEIDRLFHLLGRSRQVSFLREAAQLSEYANLTDGFAALFVSMVQASLRRGLLQGYRVEEESLHTIRGRVRTAQQLRRRFLFPLPVEVAYDDYTEDTEENRLIKAALRRLEMLRPDSGVLRARIAEALAAMTLVSDVRFSRRSLPRFRFTRLNEGFRPVLELSALIIQNVAVELRAGSRQVSALLFDMNQVFEDFVFQSLHQRLGAVGSRDGRWLQGAQLDLDREVVLRPEPDLSLWEGQDCVFVGDAKYKATAHGRLSDLYQLLAYCTAANLREGMLIYAEQSRGSSRHHVVHDGPVLHVEGIDVEAPVSAIEARCDELAGRLASMVRAARPVRI